MLGVARNSKCAEKPLGFAFDMFRFTRDKRVCSEKPFAFATKVSVSTRANMGLLGMLGVARSLPGVSLGGCADNESLKVCL